MSEEMHQKLIDSLKKYPLTKHCFTAFIQWLLCTNTENSLADYDLIDAIEKNETDRLERCEKLLTQSRNILDITTDEFCKAFGFSDDLLTKDPEKIHDILAEPLFVIDLSNNGFCNIQKLPPNFLVDSEIKKNSDFIATHGKNKFAIELKTIRMENKPKPEEGKFLGDSAKPYWWGEMFHKNATTKIEDKNKRALNQLNNTRNHYGCDKTMLVLYTRRLGTSSLMTKQSYLEELKLLKSNYPDIDYFSSKDYFGAVTFYPELTDNE